MLDLSITQLALLALITFFAAMTQSITGFGFALLTLPFFVLILDIHSAVQLTLISTLIITLLLIPFVYQDAPKQNCQHLILGSIVGFPLGFVFLNYATSTSIQLFVGIAILAALGAPYLSKRTSRFDSGSAKNSALNTGLYGFVSGMMTTSIAMPGPALALYAQNRAMGKQQTRAMIFMVFMFSYSAAIVLQWFSNGIFERTQSALVYVLIPAIIGTFFGNKISARIPDKLFRKLISVILSVTAIYLLFSSLIRLLG